MEHYTILGVIDGLTRFALEAEASTPEIAVKGFVAWASHKVGLMEELDMSKLEMWLIDDRDPHVMVYRGGMNSNQA
jgi:hypothetical protein